MLCYNVATHLLFTDPCESSPCKNGGKCKSENGQWICHCTSKYFGSSCEYERIADPHDKRINRCDYFNCLNGGTCEPTIDYTDFTCSCQTGFQGRICETKISTMAILG